jgi:hypothetical protein
VSGMATSRQRLPILSLKKAVTVIPPYPVPRQPVTKANTPRRDNMLTGRALKATIILDPAEVVVMRPGGAPRVALMINVAGRKVSADIAAKSLRKAQTTIGEAGVDGVVVIVQGKLGPGDVMLEAGLVAQVKVAKDGGQ